MNLKLQILAINTTALLPKKAYNNYYEDAAFDLFLPTNSDTIVIPPGERRLLSTGLKAIIPDEYWLKFHERSGLAFKQGIQVMAGVIDSSYTGELKVLLYNASTETVRIFPGQAMCQFTIEKIISTEISWISEKDFVKEANKRLRGENGFGSSDKLNETIKI